MITQSQNQNVFLCKKRSQQMEMVRKNLMEGGVIVDKLRSRKDEFSLCNSYSNVA